MVNGKFNEKVRTRNKCFSRLQSLSRKAAGLVAVSSLLIVTNCGMGGETPLTEYQVKALFLLNFAKYVDWPAEAFAATNTPIVIDLLGANAIEGDLNKSVKEKNVNGRQIVVRRIKKEDDFRQCHILFVGASEKKHVAEILIKTKTKPVLTVGETEQFIQHGGIINFIRKESKVLLEINVAAARQSGLLISSKLLNVADVMREKP